jgi:hypothetical protein
MPYLKRGSCRDCDFKTDWLGRVVLVPCLTCQRRRERRCLDCGRRHGSPYAHRCEPCREDVKSTALEESEEASA